MKRRSFLGTLAACYPISACQGAYRSQDHVTSPTQSEEGVWFDKEYESSIMEGYPPPSEVVVRAEDIHASREKRVWAHQHMRELCATQEISRGQGPIVPLARRMADLKNINDIEVRGSAGKTRLGKMLEETFTDAFIVLHDGKIISEQYFSGMQPNTLHLLWSCSKSISVGVVANLMNEGELKEKDPVTKYIPKLRNSGYDGSTIRHLLDMQSGVQYRFGVDATDVRRDISPAECGQHYQCAGMYRKLPDEDPAEGQYSFLKRLTNSRAHGSTFYYKNCDTAVLAWVCEKVTGDRFANLISQHIWSKLGAEQSGNILCGLEGGSTPAAGISVTLRDFARWGQMHLQDGQWNGQQVVPADFVRGLREFSDTSMIRSDSYPPPDALLSGITYHDQFWMRGAKEHAYFSVGHCGQFCYIYPKHKTVIVRFATEKELEPQYMTLLPAFADVARTVAS